MMRETPANASTFVTAASVGSDLQRADSGGTGKMRSR